MVQLHIKDDDDDEFIIFGGNAIKMSDFTQLISLPFDNVVDWGEP